jgi:putative toxin-antitoxin system antitoxin component (TIGR02293 family)
MHTRHVLLIDLGNWRCAASSLTLAIWRLCYSHMAATGSEAPDIFAQVSNLLGGRKVLRRLAADPQPAQLLGAIRVGLPAAALESFVVRTTLDTEWVTSLLGMSPRTWARRKAQAQQLTPVESDRLYRLAHAVARAADVLGSRDKGVRWLRKPNRALGGEVPMDLLDTEIGEGQVLAVLDRIEHGVFG